MDTAERGFLLLLIAGDKWAIDKVLKSSMAKDRGYIEERVNRHTGATDDDPIGITFMELMAQEAESEADTSD